MLLFASIANFVIPFLLYFASRHRATNPEIPEDPSLLGIPQENLPENPRPKTHDPLLHNQRHQVLTPVIVIDTNFVAPDSDSVPEVCTSSHSPTSVTASDRWHLAGTSVLKKRCSTRTNASIDLEHGKMLDFAPETASGKDVNGSVHVSGSFHGAGTADNDSDYGSERASFPAPLIPFCSQSQLLGFPVTDAAKEDGLFHAFPDAKYFRSCCSLKLCLSL
jgi:hypothetical protein